MTRTKQVNNENGVVLNRDFPRRGRSLIMVPEELRRLYPNAKPEYIEMALERFGDYECGEGESKIARFSTLVQVKPDQGLALKGKQQDRSRAKHQRAVKLEAKGVAHALVVALSEKLRTKQPRTRDRPEDAEVKHEQQLVDDRHARHLLGSDLPNHDVVQKAYEIGNTVLNEDRHHNGKQRSVKRAASNIFFERHFFTFLSSLFTLLFTSAYPQYLRSRLRS